MAGWRRSVSVGAILLGVVIALPIAWFNLSSHLATRSNPNRALARSVGPRKACATDSSSRRSHSLLFCSPARRLLGLSLKKVMAVSPGFRADHVLTGQFTLPWRESDARIRTRRDPRSLAGIDRPTAGSRRRRNDHEHSAERRQRQHRGRPERLCAAARSISARSLFLWRRRRLLLCSRHSVARRTVPDFGGFSSVGTGLCRRRRFCPALLAARRCARATSVSWPDCLHRQRPTIPTTRACSPLSASSAR